MLSKKADTIWGLGIMGGFFGGAFGAAAFLVDLGVGLAVILGTAIGVCIGVALGLTDIGENLWIRNLLLEVVGFIFILVLARETTLTCEQVEPSLPITCELVQSHLLGAIERKFELRGTRMVIGETEDNDPIYKVVLQTNNGEFNLQVDQSASQEGLVSYINNFVKNPGKTPLKYQYGSQILDYIFGGVFILLGLFLPFVSALRIILAKRKANLKAG